MNLLAWKRQVCTLAMQQLAIPKLRQNNGRNLRCDLPLPACPAGRVFPPPDQSTTRPSRVAPCCPRLIEKSDCHYGIARAEPVPFGSFFSGLICGRKARSINFVNKPRNTDEG